MCETFDQDCTTGLENKHTVLTDSGAMWRYGRCGSNRGTGVMGAVRVVGAIGFRRGTVRHMA